MRLKLFDLLCKDPSDTTARLSSYKATSLISNSMIGGYSPPSSQTAFSRFIPPSLYYSCMKALSPISRKRLPNGIKTEDRNVALAAAVEIMEKPISLKRWSSFVRDNPFLASHLVPFLAAHSICKGENSESIISFMDAWKTCLFTNFSLERGKEYVSLKDSLTDLFMESLVCQFEYLVKGNSESFRNSLLSSSSLANPFSVSFILDPNHPLKCQNMYSGEAISIVTCGYRYQNLQKYRHNAFTFHNFNHLSLRESFQQNPNEASKDDRLLLEKFAIEPLLSSGQRPKRYLNLLSFALMLPVSLLSAPWIHTPESSLFNLICAHPSVSNDVVWNVYERAIVKQGIPVSPYAIMHIARRFGLCLEKKERLMRDFGVPFQYFCQSTNFYQHRGKAFDGAFRTISRQASDLYSWDARVSFQFGCYRTPPPFDKIRLWPIIEPYRNV